MAVRRGAAVALACMAAQSRSGTAFGSAVHGQREAAWAAVPSWCGLNLLTQVPRSTRSDSPVQQGEMSVGHSAARACSTA